MTHIYYGYGNNFFFAFLYIFIIYLSKKKSLKKILIFENNLLNFLKNINLDIFLHP